MPVPKVDEILAWRLTSRQTRSPRAGSSVLFCVCPALRDAPVPGRLECTCNLREPEVLIQHLTEMGRLDRRVLACSTPQPLASGSRAVLRHEFCRAGRNQLPTSVQDGRLLVLTRLLPSENLQRMSSS